MTVSCVAQGPDPALSPFDIACGARRRLASWGSREQPSCDLNPALVSQLLVDAKGQLLVTSAAHGEAQRARGLRQCEGCGFFFSHPKGLVTHQQEAGERACREAGVAVASSEAEGGPQAEREGINSSKASTEGGHGTARWRPGKAEGGRAVGGEPGGDALPELLRMARDGRLEELQAAAGGGADVAGARDRHGSCALAYASGGGHVDVCRWLVEGRKVHPDSTRRR